MGEGVSGAESAAKMAANAQNEVSKGRLGRSKVNYPATTQAIKWLAFTTLVVAVIGGLAALGIGFIPGGDKAITWLTSGSYSGLNNWQLMAVTAAAAAVTGVVTVFTIALVLDRRNKSDQAQQQAPSAAPAAQPAPADAATPPTSTTDAPSGGGTAQPAPPASTTVTPAAATQPAAAPSTDDAAASTASAQAAAGAATASAQVVAVDPAKLKSWIAAQEADQSQAPAAPPSLPPRSQNYYRQIGKRCAETVAWNARMAGLNRREKELREELARVNAENAATAASAAAVAARPEFEAAKEAAIAAATTNTPERQRALKRALSGGRVIPTQSRIQRARAWAQRKAEQAKARRAASLKRRRARQLATNRRRAEERAKRDTPERRNIKRQIAGMVR